MKKFAKILLISLMVMITGCAKYKSQSLPNIHTAMTSKSSTQKNVKVGVKFLDKNECKTYFGSTEVYEKYQPALVAIQNKSNSIVTFRKSDISKPVVPANLVAKECKFNTAGRATAYGVGSLILWPLIIPAIVDGVGSSNANDKMEMDFTNKELTDAEVIPYTTHYGVLFFEKMNSGETVELKLLPEYEYEEPISYSFKA
jgi:hypothetical protein